MPDLAGRVEVPSVTTQDSLPYYLPRVAGSEVCPECHTSPARVIGRAGLRACECGRTYLMIQTVPY